MAFWRAAAMGMGLLSALSHSACDTPAQCAAGSSPELFEVTDVSPGAGSAVAFGPIAHTFSVRDAPGVFQSFTFAYGASHSAGAPVPATLHFTIASLGVGTVRYDVAPFAWTHGASHVNILVPETYAAPDGCTYTFPSPLFDYDLGAGGSGP